MSRCPDELALSRALSDGAAEIVAHVASCEACRVAWNRLERARVLARQVGAAMPSAGHREQMRTALLAAATRAPVREKRRGWRIGGGAAMAAAAIAVVVVAMRANREPPVAMHRHGAMRALSNASVAQLTWSPDEIVVLNDGMIDVEVAPLHAGERFRVIVGDAEVEVHGTAFVVTARAGRLVEVVVRHGVVEVRARDGRRMLMAGQAWREAATQVTTAAPQPQPLTPAPAPIAKTSGGAATAPRTRDVVAAPRATRDVVAVPRANRAVISASRDAVTAAESPKPRVPEELAYDEAWAAMRAGEFSQAASGFARAQLLAQTGPLAEDASFWYAVALARAGQQALATSAFRDYLAASPTSRRAGEASAMLGWLLVEAGDAREAAQRFRFARSSSDPAVRVSAEAGLAAVAKLP